MTQFGQAIALSPDYPDPHNNLASAMAQSGNLDRAIVEYGKALERKSDYTEAHLGLGAILAQSGRLDEAIPHLKEAADLDEKNPAARANLCLALVSARRPDEAIPQCEQAVNLSGHGDPRFLEMLGKAYADANRLEDAIGATRHGVDVARAANDEATARHLGETLATYEAEAAGQAKRR
jgi:tetratricopeptide (TPR) repeat protein